MPVTVLAAEVGVQLARSSTSVLVDDGDVMARLVQGVGERGPHPTATHDDDVHGRERYTAGPAASRAARWA